MSELSRRQFIGGGVAAAIAGMLGVPERVVADHLVEEKQDDGVLTFVIHGDVSYRRGPVSMSVEGRLDAFNLEYEQDMVPVTSWEHGTVRQVVCGSKLNFTTTQPFRIRYEMEER